MSRYYRRYDEYFDWAAYHERKRRRLTSLFGGVDREVLAIFLALPGSQLGQLLDRYGAKYGRGAKDYAKKTFPDWKSGAVNPSGQTIERLLDFLPPLLSEAQRLDLVRQLRKHYLRRVTAAVKTTPEDWRASVTPLVAQTIERSRLLSFPPELYAKATWIADGNGEGANRLLAAVEEEDARARTRLLDAEFARIDQLLTHLQSLRAVSHTIELPQGSVHVRIHRRSWISRRRGRTQGRAAMGKDNYDLVPREELQRALQRKQSSGELLKMTLDDLSPEQRHNLADLVMKEKVHLEAEQARADQRFERSTRDMANTIDAVRALERSTKSDYVVRSSYETASGTTDIQVKRSYALVIVVVAVVLGIVLLVALGK